MSDILRFFKETGKLKAVKRSGWVLRGIKNSESVADHTFRVALMAWILGKQKHGLNIEKLLKMVLVHSLCEVYAGDITPYDSILPKDARKKREMLKTWPKFSKAEKEKFAEKKFKLEKAGLEKLVKSLPVNLKAEIMSLWLDSEKFLSKEARFFKQVDRAENMLQSLEYWEKDKKLSQKHWWIKANELFDDKLILELIGHMNKEFHKTHKPKH